MTLGKRTTIITMSIKSGSNGGGRVFNSHDHIQEIQKITGGHILVAEHKKPSIAELSLYAGVSGGNPAYFINCPFPKSILQEKKRHKKFATKLGFRHDITLDFEKKKVVPGGWVKDENITDAEKQGLLNVLAKLPWVAWSGKTPHGVHAGIYFTDWTANSKSGRVLDWVMDELAAVGYSGPLKLDWNPSVNCNRPSRFLKAFDFWRPTARLDVSVVTSFPAKSTPQKLKMKKAGSTSGSLKDQAVRDYALFCRSYMLTADETAAKVKRSVVWVNQVWQANPQTAFNTFNMNLGRYVGPRSSRGQYKQTYRKWKPELYRNAGWSWEWCWSVGMSASTAKKHVFTDSNFDELLKLLHQAYDTSVKLNGGVQVYKSWVEWVEADIDRCFLKYGFGGLKSTTIETIKKVIVNGCIAAGNNHTSISHIARVGPHHSKDIVKKAFSALGLVKKGSGYNAYYPVPSAWLASPVAVPPVHSPHQAYVANAVNKNGSSPVPVPAASSAGKTKRKPKGTAGKAVASSAAPLTLEAFWNELAPAMLPSPAPVPDFMRDEIRRMLAPAIGANPDWERLTDEDDMDYKHDDLLEVVRKCLTADGHVYHTVKNLQAVLKQILGGSAEFYYAWLFGAGYIVSVSGLLGLKDECFAWRETLLGEARFGWRVVEHCWHGGGLEIITGEPGTGKTETLARRLVAAQGKCVGGSSQNHSALQLEERIKKLKGRHKVQTIHKAYNFQSPVHRKGTGFKRGDVFYGDEVGQLDCEPAGVMAMRWRPGSQVLLTVGEGQNLPVGAGAVGEDLISWARANPGRLPTLKLTELTENFRLKGAVQAEMSLLPGVVKTAQPDTSGIVRAFQAVGRGMVPVAGPGLEIEFCANESEVARKVTALGKKLGAMCLMPTKAGADAVNAGFRTSGFIDGEPVEANPWEFYAGEKLLVNIVKHGKAKKAGLRKGDIVEVISDNFRGYNPENIIEVWKPDGNRGYLHFKEVARTHGRTGHSTQGLESDVIVVGITSSRAATKRWLYTAISRCRQSCVIVCTRAGLSKCVKSNLPRRTLLPFLLERALARFNTAGVPSSNGGAATVRRGSSGARSRRKPVSVGAAGK
jgi:hypothetical protein